MGLDASARLEVIYEVQNFTAFRLLSVALLTGCLRYTAVVAESLKREEMAQGHRPLLMARGKRYAIISGS